MKRMQSFFRINPIIVKELRSRMRGPRAFLTLTISLVVTGGILYGFLQVMIAMSAYSSDLLSPRIGQALFAALAFIELVVVCAVTPAVTSGAISGEREKQTYDLLQATPLSPASLLWGKLISALGYIFILLFAAVPLASLVFIFGGVPLRDMLKALLVLLVLTGSFGVLGLFMSALFKRTGRATIASFVVVAILALVPLFMTVAIGIVRQSEANVPRWLLALSPVSMLLSTINVSGGGSLGIFYQLIPFLGGYWMQSAIAPVSMASIPRPLYHYSIPFYLGLALILYLLATRLMQPFHRWRMKPREWITGIALVLGFAGTVAGLFLLTADRYEWVKPPTNQAVILQPAGPAPIVVQNTIIEVTVDPNAPTPDGTVTATPTPAQAGGGVNSIPFTPVASAGLFLDQPDTAAEIYALTARELLPDGEAGAQPPVIYLLDKTDDAAGDPSAPANSSLLPEEVKAGISRRLSDLNIPVEFAASRDDVITDYKTYEVRNGGAVITFGNIRSRPDGYYEVPASIYLSGKSARGGIFLVIKENGVWKFSGSTGAEWVS